MSKKIDPNKIIDLIGGSAETGRLCKVTSEAVSQWRKNGIPEYRMMYLRLAVPEVFKQLKLEEIANARSSSMQP